MFGWGLVVWMLVLVPVLVLLQVDALLVYRTSREVLRDIALLLLLAPVPAALLAALGGAVGGLLRAVGWPRAGLTAAWAIVILPTAGLALWQLARAGAALVKGANEFHLSLGPTARGLAGAAIVLLLLGLWWRMGLAQMLRAVLPPVLSLRPLALLTLAAAAGLVALQPTLPWRVAAARPPLNAAAATPARPDVILITLDSLAAADAGVCGSGPTTMPRLRALAARATCFDRHYASANFTTPSTSTLETATLPWTHFAGQVGAQVIPTLQGHSLAMALYQAGYATHSVNANLLASPRHHGTWRAYVSEEIADSTSITNRFEALVSKLADSIAPQLLSGLFPPELDFLLLHEDSPVDPAWTYERVPPLLRAALPGQPLLLWVHTLPPHAPYLPPKSTKHKLLPPGELDNFHQFRTGNTPFTAQEQPWIDKHRLRYQETIMGADESLGVFLDELDRAGRLRNALVVVSADHGESFEKGLIGHAGPLLHDALIRIPLVIKLPGQTTGRVVRSVVSQADITPTILDAVGVTALPHAEGRSLKPLLLGQDLPPAPAFAMAMERQSRFKPLTQGHFAVMDGHHKAVYHLPEGRLELFDTEADPGERQDIASTQPAVAQRLKALLQQRLQMAEARRLKGLPGPLGNGQHQEPADAASPALSEPPDKTASRPATS